MTTRKKQLVYTKSWPRKNLGELLNFLEQMHPEGISLKALSAKLGMTPGAISNIFMRDDMKLSKAESIVRAYGYELKLFFPTRTFPEGITPPQHGKTFDTAGNLQGLARYIYDGNRTINYVAHSMGMYATMLSNSIKKGDIFLSKLYNVTDSMGICFYWKYIKQEQQEQPNQS